MSYIKLKHIGDNSIVETIKIGDTTVKNSTNHEEEIVSKVDGVKPIFVKSKLANVVPVLLNYNLSGTTEEHPFEISPFDTITEADLDIKNIENLKGKFALVGFTFASVVDNSDILVFTINGVDYKEAMNNELFANNARSLKLWVRVFPETTEGSESIEGYETSNTITIAYKLKSDKQIIEKKIDVNTLTNGASKESSQAYATNYRVFYIDDRMAYNFPLKFTMPHANALPYTEELIIDGATKSYSDKTKSHGDLLIKIAWLNYNYNYETSGKVTIPVQFKNPESDLNKNLTIPNGGIQYNQSDFYRIGTQKNVTEDDILNLDELLEEKGGKTTLEIRNQLYPFYYWISTVNLNPTENPDGGILVSEDQPDNAKLAVLSGDLTLYLVKEGFLPQVHQLNLTSGEHKVLDVTFEPLKAHVTIKTHDEDGVEWPNTTIYVNDEVYNGEELQWEFGSEYTVLYRRKGFEDYVVSGLVESETINIEPVWTAKQNQITIHLFDDANTVISVPNTRVEINGTVQELKGGVITYNTADLTAALEVKFMHNWFVEETKTLQLSEDKLAYELKFTRKAYKLRFETKPKDATVYIKNGENAIPVKDKVKTVYGGDVIEYSATANNYNNSQLYKFIVNEATNLDTTLKIELTPVNASLKVVAGENSDLTNAIVTCKYVDLNGKEEIIPNAKSTTLPFGSKYEITVKEQGYTPKIINGEVTSIEDIIVTINDWSKCNLTIILPEDIVNPIINGTVTYDGHTQEKTLVSSTANQVRFNSVVNFTLVSDNYQDFTLETPVTANDKNISIDLTRELYIKIIEKKQFKLSWDNVNVLLPDGNTKLANVTVNGKVFEPNVKETVFEADTEVTFAVREEGYTEFVKTFNIVQNTHISEKIIKQLFRQKNYQIILNVTESGTTNVLNGAIVESTIYPKIYNGTTIELPAFSKDKIRVSCAGYNSKELEIRFVEATKTINVELTKIAENVETNFNNMTPSERNAWLDKMFDMFNVMGMYRHIRIGRYIRIYGVTEKGLRLFYKYFDRYLQHQYDYIIYQELKDKFGPLK